MTHATRRFLIAFALPAALGLPAAASAAPQPAGSVQLSDGRTFAHWAHPEKRAFVRRRPSRKSRLMARLHFRTEDRFPEVYPVLRRFTDRKRRTWLRIRIPGRPNGRTGWVRDTALGPLNRVRTRLEVNRGSLRATLYRSGRRIWRSRIGVGTPSTPTPAGRFWIREKFRVRNSGGPFGPYAFGTGAYSVLSEWPGGGVIGIHGTNQPGLIPGRPSHGCIRLPNPAIRRLARLMPVGTPIRIR
jgi:hypothetical protein